MLFAVLAVLTSAVAQCTTGPLAIKRVDLKVLVLNDGGFGVAPLRDQLKLEGVPYREINLADPARPVINAAFLESTIAGSPTTERAFYQAVVVPTEATPQLSTAERDALNAYRSKYGIRQVDAYTFANPNTNGMNWAEGANGFIGSLDGKTATVTAAGLTGPFKYLTGSVPFDVGSYGSVATTATTLPAGTTFTPMVTVPIPGSATPGAIVGVYSTGGREELVITSSFNAFQQQYRLLAHGIVTWMTKGVHLGFNRSYLTVHVDDVFAADSRWNPTLNCTPGEDCPQGTPEGTPLRMTPADVTRVAAWQQANGFTYDMVFNGLGTADHLGANGLDPLTEAFKANKNAFRWVNHTYTHAFLGCVQVFQASGGWNCSTTNGQINWVPRATIEQEIQQNLDFATQHGLRSLMRPNELVTGEHSGLFLLPNYSVDNPNLDPALRAKGITVTGGDASRDFEQRTLSTQANAAKTLPRYPLSLFFNTGTKAEAIDEYNWIFTSREAGGSGKCTDNGFVCLDPINATTGFDDWIVPFDTAATLRRMMSNDPRPYYVHQNNFAEDDLLTKMMTSILGRYRGLVAANAPFINPTMTEASRILTQQKAWQTGVTQVEAYMVGNEVFVNRGAYTGEVPITVPAGTKIGSSMGASFGTAHGGEQSAWSAVPFPGQSNKLVIP